VNHRLPISAVIVLALTTPPAQLHGQSPDQHQGPIFTTQTTTVLVPALIREKSGATVYTLNASDFTLTDNGVPQKLTLDPESGSQPLALVVVLEIGGAGARAFQNYDTIAPPLAPMLNSVVGSVRSRIAVVTFDSQPNLLEPFTSDVDEASDALRRLKPGCTRQEHYENCTGPNPIHDIPLGDNGAAILDSLSFAVKLLRAEPGYRHAILLVSETLDRGSLTTIDQAVRAIAESNTTIYSIGFSTAKSETAHYAYRQLPTQRSGRTRLGFLDLENHHPNPPNGCMGTDPDPDPDAPTSKWSQFYDCLGQLVPPLTFARMAAIATADSLQQNVPATVARLTGGEYYKLGDAKRFERDLITISNHVPNRYMLSFHPPSPQAGLHVLRLKLTEYPDLEITARTSYWSEPPDASPMRP
jgi:VWFA-related protein